MKRLFSHAGWWAALLFAGSAFFFAADLEGYSHRVHPLGLLGAYGTPHALAFNLCGLVAPGLLAAWLGWRLREDLERSGWTARIGAWLVLLSALAFSAQGLLRLDPRDIDAITSRLHAASWMVWWIAFVPGAALLAGGLFRRPEWRGLAIASVVAAAVVLLFAAWLPAGVPTAISHRIAFAAWFAWLIVAGYAANSQRPRM